MVSTRPEWFCGSLRDGIWKWFLYHSEIQIFLSALLSGGR
jgi:hypothetical protein